jgi:hypothetical protein
MAWEIVKAFFIILGILVVISVCFRLMGMTTGDMRRRHWTEKRIKIVNVVVWVFLALVVGAVGVAYWFGPATAP